MTEQQLQREAEQRAEERAAFLSRRKQGIGGSDVAAIFGLDPYRSAEDLWMEKTGQTVSDDVDNYHKRRGRMFEPVVRQLWHEDHPEFTFAPVINLAVHPEYPWMIANYDGVAIDANENEAALIEVKCPSIGAYRKIQREGMKTPWILQMQHYLCVSGMDRGTFVVFCADMCELIEFTVERDDALIATLIEKEREFWILVETMTPPPAVVREFSEAPEIEQVGTVTKRNDDAFKTAVSQLREAKELVATAEEVEENAKARVLELVGNATGIYEGGGARVYFTPTKGRTTFDKKKLIAATPLDHAAIEKWLDAQKDADALAALNEFELRFAAGEFDLDLARFDSTGKPGTQFKTYFVGGA